MDQLFFVMQINLISVHIDVPSHEFYQGNS